MVEDSVVKLEIAKNQCSGRGFALAMEDTLMSAQLTNVFVKLEREVDVLSMTKYFLPLK